MRVSRQTKALNHAKADMTEKTFIDGDKQIGGLHKSGNDEIGKSKKGCGVSEEGKVSMVS